MRIAVYISPVHSAPPENESILAPWRLVPLIINGLVDRGHDVTLFSARGSQSKAKLIDLGMDPFDDKRYKLSDKDFTNYTTFYEHRLGGEMYRMAHNGDFDIVNVHHLVYRMLALASLSDVPTVNTLHDPIDDRLYNYYEQYGTVKQISYISISNSQRAGRALPFSGTVYNGLNLSLFPFSNHATDRLLIIGRIRKEKGFVDAIEVSQKTMFPLMISGEYYPQFPELYRFWEEKVKPAIDNKNIFYKGIMRQGELGALYGQAKALLFPIHWEEPFGLVMIEAMAAGTPVVAYNRGSVSEIVRDGVTGFIINEMPNAECQMINGKQLQIQKTGVEGLVEAVKRIGEIDRAACRRHVEENFTVEKMVEGYEKVYKKILASKG